MKNVNIFKYVKKIFILFFHTFLRSWKDYFWIVIGSAITAISINVFLVPYKIAPGGVSGLATVIYYLSGGKFPVGATMLVLNIPLLIIGLKFLGGRFTIRTFFGTIVLSAIITILEPISRYFVSRYLVTPDKVSFGTDILLYSVFGGFLLGAGLGLVFRYGATTGGSDLAGRIINHFSPHLTMGQTILFIDSSIIVLAAVAFDSIQLGLYAIVTLFISSKVIDGILEGVNFAKAVYIISDKSQIIAQEILTGLDRGVTSLKGTGMYTGNEKQVLFCVLHRGQIQSLKKIVRDIDDKAFIILTDVREVLGEGFKTYD